MIQRSTEFLHSFFFGSDTYSADAIDRKAAAGVIDFCLENRMIEVTWNNGKRLYRILPEGKKVIDRK